jgi:tetratricopeptide (TPR) repeat protein
MKSTIIFFIFFLLMVPSSILHANQGDKPEVKKKNDTAKIDPYYWYNKGAICATYGNDMAAIKYFKRAVKRNPQNDIFYFALGISHGEIGEYATAIMYIDKALNFSPSNGLYYYGRARVWQLSGNNSKAIEDFLHARMLGSIDAQKYLQYIGHQE